MSSISEFAEREFIGLTETSLPKAALRLIAPLSLPERRIYVYVEIYQAVAAAYELRCEVQCMRRGQPIGTFPCCIAGNAGTNANKSVASLFNAGGSPVGDSIVLRLASPFDANFPYVTIQPFRINAEIDEVRFVPLSKSGTVEGIRTYLAVVSTKY